MRIQPVTLAWTLAAGFLALAVLGFLPNPVVGSTALFVTNTGHDLLHLITGVGFATVAALGPRASTRFMLAAGAFGTLVAAYGFIALGGASEGNLLGVIHINALDNFLHAGFAAVISAAGYLSYKAKEWSAAPAVVTSAVLLLVGTVVVTGLGANAEVTVEAAQPMTQRYVTFTDEHRLVRPDGYRRWVYVGAPLTPNDLNPPEAPFPEFHNVYIDPASYEYYSQTGTFPDGTTLVKELVSVGSKKAVSGNGYFMGDFIGLETAVKSSEHFPDEPGNWAYFSFGHAYPLADTAEAFDRATCSSCHQTAADDDFVFTQYYPILRAGREARPTSTGTVSTDGQ